MVAVGQTRPRVRVFVLCVRVVYVLFAVYLISRWSRDAIDNGKTRRETDSPLVMALTGRGSLYLKPRRRDSAVGASWRPADQLPCIVDVRQMVHQEKQEQL